MTSNMTNSILINPNRFSYPEIEKKVLTSQIICLKLFEAVDLRL